MKRANLPEGTKEGKLHLALPSLAIKLSNAGFSTISLSSGLTPIGNGATATFGSVRGKLIVSAVKMVSAVNKKKSNKKEP